MTSASPAMWGILGILYLGRNFGAEDELRVLALSFGHIILQGLFRPAIFHVICVGHVATCEVNIWSWPSSASVCWNELSTFPLQTWLGEILRMSAQKRRRDRKTSNHASSSRPWTRPASFRWRCRNTSPWRVPPPELHRRTSSLLWSRTILWLGTTIHPFLSGNLNRLRREILLPQSISNASAKTYGVDHDLCRLSERRLLLDHGDDPPGGLHQIQTRPGGDGFG